MSVASLVNSSGQKLDVIVLPDGTVKLKMAVGTKDVAGQSDDAAWQGVATHADGAAWAASDGVVVLAGVDPTGTDTVRALLVDASGRPFVVLVPSQASMTDRSGTITTGGTRQQIAAANVSRRYFLFQNISDTDMWLNWGTNAVADQPSLKVVAGGSFVQEGSFVDTQRIDVMCATTGKKFTAKEA